MSAEDAPTQDDRQFEVSLGKFGVGSVAFGRYKLVREIGRGGMGVVWLAQDERVDIPVALKFLPDIVARDVESVDELKRELRRGLSLTHPGIVRVYSFEQDETGAAIAMEYVDGPTLGSLKAKQPGAVFDCDELLPWVEQLCSALDYAHFEAKIVHRDLKPRNLMLTSKGRIKIADFGVATSISDTISRVSVRRDGSGTPPYMSPQQAFGEDPSPSDDLYSMAATIYELLTGRPPFYQGNILAQVHKRVPPTMTERREVLKVTGRKSIPVEWEATIAACLAKQQEDRPLRASEVLEALKGLRPAPVVQRQQPESIDPAATFDSSSDLYQSRPNANAGDTATRGIGVAYPSEDPTRRAGEGVPASSGNGLLIAAAAVLAVGGFAAWWTLRDGDKARDDSGPGVVTDGGASATIGAASPSPEPAADEISPELLLADTQAMAEGRIPKGAAPWTNGIGMKFVPVPGVKPLVAVHELRVEDYRAFASETSRPWTAPEFVQGENHPAVNLTWDDARAFAKWLTDKERQAGKLGVMQRYRLLTDAEWSAAVGLSGETGAMPGDKDSQIKGVYPWGASSPPAPETENLAGEGETALSETELQGYRDGFSHTAPTGAFKANAFGIHDLGGNVAEWVEDWYDSSNVERTVRGAAFVYISRFDLNSSFRWHLKPAEFADYIGARLAIDLGPADAGTAPER